MTPLVAPEALSHQPPLTSRQRLRRLQQGYSAVAIVLLNTIVVYLLLNMGLGLAFAVRDAFRTQSNPVSLTYGARLDAVYPDMPEPERTQMLSEAWNRPYRYADFIHFQERPCSGKYVNVDEAGFRHSIDQGPWPPDPTHFNVFCFGGSTMFGYGVRDTQTVASCLQLELTEILQRRVSVYNFGVGWHFSTQERLRFEQLLASDLVPHVAVFLDGINDSTQAALNRPAFSEQLAVAFEQSQAFGFQSPREVGAFSGSMLGEALFFRWPVGRLARSLTPQKPASKTDPIVLDIGMAERSCAVYRWNRTLIAAAAKARGVTPIFIVQPAPGHQLDTKKHLFANPELCRNEAVFYKALQQDLEKHPSDNGLLWCAELPSTTPGLLYVDTCHYTAKFSQVIARDIAKQCQDRKLLRP